jgi:hypothetical protein
MTLTEIQEIFKTVPVLATRPEIPPVYQYYLFTERNRGAGAINAKDIDTLVDTLAGYSFGGYAQDGNPCFVLYPDAPAQLQGS